MPKLIATIQLPRVLKHGVQGVLMVTRQLVMLINHNLLARLVNKLGVAGDGDGISLDTIKKIVLTREQLIEIKIYDEIQKPQISENPNPRIKSGRR